MTKTKKKVIKLLSDTKIYVVINRYISGVWGVADFWNKLPYSSTSFDEIKEYKKDIIDLSSSISCNWCKDDFKIVKIFLDDKI